MDSISQLKAELSVSVPHHSHINENPKSDIKKLFSKITTLGLSLGWYFGQNYFFLSDFEFEWMVDRCDNETLNSAFSCEIEFILIEYKPHLTPRKRNSNDFHSVFYSFFRLND